MELPQHNKKIKTILFVLCVLLSALASADSDNWYQINVIVFEHISVQGLSAELWPAITNPPKIGNALAPNLLSLQSSQLLKEASKLAKTRGYRVLLNIAWQQQIPVTNKGQLLHISGGANYNGVSQVDGTIIINKSRYFDVTTNLILTELTNYLDNIGPGNYSKDAISSGFHSFQMHQSVRMRSNQLAYIDHPLYGMLIKIMSIDAPRVLKAQTPKL